MSDGSFYEFGYEKVLFMSLYSRSRNKLEINKPCLSVLYQHNYVRILGNTVFSLECPFFMKSIC